MSATTDKLCKCGSITLTMVNGLILLAGGHQLNRVSLHHGDAPEPASTSIHALLHMPSVLVAVLTVVLLALLIGKEWLRPSWLPFVLNLGWLAASALLLLKLNTLLM